jgi:hypothetical protein
MTEFECPDVFELDGKMVVITSFSNRSKGVYTHHYQPVWVGEMSSDDLKFIPDEKTGPPDRLDYGAVGVSTMYAGKTGTEALPPFTRRVLMGFTGYGNIYLTNCLRWYSLPRDLSLSSTGKLLQHPVREAVVLRKKESIYPALALGSQIEVLVRCELPAAGVPKAGVLALRTLLAAGTDQRVTVGYNFSSMLGFADVPASLSNCGSTDTRWSVQCNGPTARTDTAPLPREFVTASMLELRVFVDGHMLETFFGGHAVITTVTGNTVSSSNITSSIVNTANLECNISSWTLALKSDDSSDDDESTFNGAHSPLKTSPAKMDVETDDTIDSIETYQHHSTAEANFTGARRSPQKSDDSVHGGNVVSTLVGKPIYQVYDPIVTHSWVVESGKSNLKYNHDSVRSNCLHPVELVCSKTRFVCLMRSQSRSSTASGSLSGMQITCISKLGLAKSTTWSRQSTDRHGQLRYEVSNSWSFIICYLLLSRFD